MPDESSVRVQPQASASSTKLTTVLKQALDRIDSDSRIHIPDPDDV